MGRLSDQGQIVTQFALVILIALFSSTAAAEGGESSGVGNGGGPAEQAIVAAAIHSITLYKACLLHPQCGLNTDLAAALKAIELCAIPAANQLKFDKIEVPFAKRDDALTINRTLLYPNSQPLSFSSSVGYLTRVYFDVCGVKPFAESESLIAPLMNFSYNDGEQITVGRNDLNLPKEKFIRARTLYSDLLIQTSAQMLRVHCNDDTLDSCSVIEDAKTGANSRFRNLSVASESKDSACRISFSIEGLFRNGKGLDEKFVLNAITNDGVADEVRIQGRTLELPKK